MKKVWGIVVLGLLAVVTADADVASFLCVLGPGKTASPACASGTCDGTADSTTGTIDISKASYIRVQAYCAVGPTCTGVLTINVRSKCNSSTCVTPPFQPLISCTNVTTAGVCSNGATGYMNIPVGGSLNIVQSGTAAGTFGAIVETHTITP
jgi:hypothetical protein